jgi:hypothetical protein
MQNRVFIQQQIGLARREFSGDQPRSQFFGKLFQLFENPPDIRSRALRVLHHLAPDRLPFDEFVAQRLPFQPRVFGEEGITISKLRDGSQKRAFRGGNEGHVHSMYTDVRGMYYVSGRTEGDLLISLHKTAGF